MVCLHGPSEKKTNTARFCFHDPLLDYYVLKTQEITYPRIIKELIKINNQKKVLKRDQEELNRLPLLPALIKTELCSQT
jgi:hypothetical protein